MNPSGLCTDGEFLRRAYLDLLGILPTAEEARAFVADEAPDKRAKLVDRLLERPEFADFWALKWADLLRIEERTLDRKGVQNFHHWIREAVARNTPLDQFVREAGLRPRQHLHQPAGELLPRAPRPGHPRRDGRPALPRHATAVRPVPQPPVRPLDAGRLLRLGRRLRPRRLQAPGEPPPRHERQPRVRRRADRLRGRRRRREGPARRPPGQAAAARHVVQRLRRPGPPRRPGGLDDVAGQPVLRQGAGEPDLVPPDGPRDRRPGGRLPRHQPAEPPGVARRAGEGLRRQRLRRAAHDPADHGLADVRPVVRPERDQRRRRGELLARPARAG